MFGFRLLPLTYVDTAFQNIVSQLPIHINELQEFVQYFPNIYLYGPKFPPTRWNHFNLIGFIDRTNNALEGHHRSINAYVTF